MDFPTHDINSSDEQVKGALERSKARFGLVPNLFAYMAEAPQTIDAYMQLADLLDKTSLTVPQAQAIQLALSIANGCDFCTTAHTAVSKMGGLDVETIKEIREGREISDAKIKALVALALKINEKRGWLDDAELEEFFAAGFAHKQVFEVILCVTIKVLSNYTNHLTKPEANPELVEGAKL